MRQTLIGYYLIRKYDPKETRGEENVSETRNVREKIKPPGYQKLCIK